MMHRPRSPKSCLQNIANPIACVWFCPTKKDYGPNRISIRSDWPDKNAPLDPISTLPEHLHSTSLSHAKTTWKHTNQKEKSFFPLYRSLPVSRSPTPPYTPLHRETQPHPLLLAILYFGAYEASWLLGCSLLSLVCVSLTKLPVFNLFWLY